jgi:hypothetical protein
MKRKPWTWRFNLQQRQQRYQQERPNYVSTSTPITRRWVPDTLVRTGKWRRKEVCEVEGKQSCGTQTEKYENGWWCRRAVPNLKMAEKRPPVVRVHAGQGIANSWASVFRQTSQSQPRTKWTLRRNSAQARNTSEWCTANGRRHRVPRRRWNAPEKSTPKVRNENYWNLLKPQPQRKMENAVNRVGKAAAFQRVKGQRQQCRSHDHNTNSCRGQPTETGSGCQRRPPCSPVKRTYRKRTSQNTHTHTHTHHNNTGSTTTAGNNA